MHKLIKYALMAGVIPLPWFLLWITAGGQLSPQYNAISQHGSEMYAAGNYAAQCLKVAAIGSGLAFIAFGAGVWTMSGRTVAFGALAWILFGLSMMSNGVWPMGDPKHGLYAVGIANLVAPALSHIELAPWLKSQRYYVLTALVSAAGILYLWLNLTGNDPQAFRGLTQRVFSSIGSLWPFAIGLALAGQVQQRDA